MGVEYSPGSFREDITRPPRGTSRPPTQAPHPALPSPTVLPTIRSVLALNSPLLPPPSSLSGKNGRLGLGMIGTLRATLASGAFDFDTGRVKPERLGVARDRVCDMLMEVERSVRRNAGGRVFA